LYIFHHIYDTIIFEMSKHHECSKCSQTFATKTKQANHLCNQLDPSNAPKKLTRDDLANIFNFCMNTLKTGHLVDHKALLSLSYLLNLKLLEPHINSNIINIDNYDFSSGMHIYEIDKDLETKLRSLTRFSNLVKDDENNISINLKYIWEIILSVHPLTKTIFMKGKGFDIQHINIYKKLIDKINLINFDIDIDVVGDAYNEVLNNTMTGKVLGQYIIPPIIKNIMINLIDPKLKADGTIETIFDLSMGIGGFLISSLNHLIKQSKTHNININWDFVTKQGINGREEDPDIYQLAISNMWISSGHIFTNLENSNPVSNPIESKYDIVLAAPTSKDIIKQYRANNDYLPIKSNSIVSLFLQIIIYILNINGRCAIVFPDGKELFSKSQEFVTVRKFLMKTCDLKEVIQFPAGMFTYNKIKTCILYFDKKKIGSDIVTLNIKYKDNKEVDRAYTFIHGHQTHIVKFFEYDRCTNEKKILSSITIDTIANNNYSLNYSDYSKSKLNKLDFQPDVKLMKIDDICEFLQNSKHHTSYGKDTGKYKFHTTSTKNKFCDIADYNDECIIITSGGTPNIKLDNNFSCSSFNHILKSKDQNVDIKYIYYYLSYNMNILVDGYIGITIKHITKDYITKILIPIPPLETQKVIIAKCESSEIENRHLEAQIKRLEAQIKNTKYTTDIFIDNTLMKPEYINPKISSQNNIIKCFKPDPAQDIPPIKPKRKRGLIIVE